MSKTEKNAGNLSLLGGRPCLDFVNTLDWRGTDRPVEFLGTYDDLIHWSLHAGTLSAAEAKRLSRKAAAHHSRAAGVLRKAIGLREVVYRMFAAVAGGRSIPDEDLSSFNRYLRTTMQSTKIFRSGGKFRWETAADADKLDGILNPLVRSAAELLVSDELKRVKQCGDPQCGWLFLDVSRNRSRRWCDMSDCGNRAKASRFYRKKKVITGMK